MITLDIEEVKSTSALPLYTDYCGQESRAYIFLDTRTAEVWTGEKAPFENGVSMAQWHGHVRAYKIPNNLTAGGLSMLLNDKALQALLVRVAAGATEEWDGSNHVTTLDDDAGEANDAALRFCDELIPEDYGSLDVWDAYQWLDSEDYGDLVQPGEDDEDAVYRIRAEALKNGVYMTHANLKSALAYKKEQAESEEKGE